MNATNIKRLENVREALDELEEELLPCYVEEDHRLRLLCESEMFSDEQVELDNIVSSLEYTIRRIRRCRKSLDFVLNYENQQGEKDHVK